VFRKSDVKSQYCPELLVSGGWIRWINLEDFAADSFYNLALPLAPYTKP
jgi:hypothetical protein